MMEHARNINELLNLSKNLVRQRINLRGTVLMGYSRKHHSSALTELFPVAIPTLICCLQALLGKTLKQYHENLKQSIRWRVFDLDRVQELEADRFPISVYSGNVLAKASTGRWRRFPG